MRKIFTDHPRSIGETYIQHLKFATYFGFHLTLGGIACIIHAIFPFLFKTTGSDILFKMMHFYINRMPCMEERMVDIAERVGEKDLQLKTSR